VVVVVCGAPVVVLAVRSGSGDPKWGFNNRRLKTKNGGFNTRRWNCRQSTSWLLDPQLFHSVPAIPPPAIEPPLQTTTSDHCYILQLPRLPRPQPAHHE
jgi:hypothetical protein